MRFSLAANFDDALIEQFAAPSLPRSSGSCPKMLPAVDALPTQIVGVNQPRVADHVLGGRQ
jgi:hypothetical protein